MPNPIPDWDLSRRLVKYIGMKQIIGELITVRTATVVLGIGRERMISAMDEAKIIYKIFSGKEGSGSDLIALEYVPHNLALDAGVANSELDKSYRKLLDRKLKGEIKIIPRRQTRLTKKQREQMKVREFWSASREP